MKYGITAGTGQFAQDAISELVQLVPVKNIVVIARDTEKAKEMYPTGVEIRYGDYNDTESMTTAFKDIKRILFISSQPDAEHPRIKQHANVVNAAEAAKVKFIAYTSFPQAQISKSPLAVDHKKTEDLIKQTEITHAFLRNNWYLRNEKDLIDASIKGEDFIFSAGEGTVGWALEKYYAFAAARVLCEESDTQEVFEFHGLEYTYADLAMSVNKVTKKAFKVTPMDDNEYHEALKKRGCSKSEIDFKVMVQDMIRDGDLSENLEKKDVKFGMSEKELFDNVDENASDLPQILKHPIPSLDDQVKELLIKKPKYIV